MVIKVNISMPEKVLKELDKAANEANTSRSAFNRGSKALS